MITYQFCFKGRSRYIDATNMAEAMDKFAKRYGNALMDTLSTLTISKL